jgi:hypothetical protein
MILESSIAWGVGKADASGSMPSALSPPRGWRCAAPSTCCAFARRADRRRCVCRRLTCPARLQLRRFDPLSVAPPILVTRIVMVSWRRSIGWPIGTRLRNEGIEALKNSARAPRIGDI